MKKKIVGCLVFPFNNQLVVKVYRRPSLYDGNNSVYHEYVSAYHNTKRINSLLKGYSKLSYATVEGIVKNKQKEESRNNGRDSI